LQLTQFRRIFLIWQYQKENIRKREVESAELTGIVLPLKWVFVHNAVNQNYPIEHVIAAGTNGTKIIACAIPKNIPNISQKCHNSVIKLINIIATKKIRIPTNPEILAPNRSPI
jgi:hypothetical protein